MNKNIIVNHITALILILTMCVLLFNPLFYIGSDALENEYITYYTSEEISSNDSLYAIGATRPEYVVAKFDNNNNSIIITRNGIESNGLMKDNPFGDGNNNAATVIIYDGVKNVGAAAFKNCANLKLIKIGNSITTLGEKCFYNCIGLETLILGRSVKEVDIDDLTTCTSLSQFYCFKDSIIDVYTDNYQQISNIKHYIGDIDSDGDITLSDYTSIKSEISESNGPFVPEQLIVGDYNLDNAIDAFDLFSIDKKINGLEESAQADNTDTPAPIARHYTDEEIAADDHVIPMGATNPNDVLLVFNEDFSKGVLYNNTETSDGKTKRCLDIEERVAIFSDNPKATLETIRNAHGIDRYYAIADVCAQIKYIDIKEGITSLGYGVTGFMSNCDFNIPSTLTEIAGDNFSFTGLTHVEIPEGVSIIDSRVFWGNEKLTSVVIPSGVRSIGEGAFACCSSLSSITVDSNNTVYDSRNDCNAIIETASNTLIAGCKSTIIPADITKIGSSAFSWRTSLKSITIPDSVTSIGEDAFYYCTSLESVTIPDSVTSISNSAFYCCTSLESITIPDGVTSIGNNAFYGCSALTGVVIPESVTSIDEGTFSGCSSLTSITIPDSVMYIYDSAFDNCESLTTIECVQNSYADSWAQSHGYNVKYIFNYTAEEIAINENLFAIGATHPEYVVAKFSDDGTKVTIRRNGISSDGLMSDYPFGYDNTINGNITEAIVDNGIKNIGVAAFKSTNISSVSIGVDVESIGTFAFAMTHIDNVVLPEGLKTIGNGAFGKCDALSSMIIPDSVTSALEMTFYECPSLQYLRVGNGVCALNQGFLYECNNLETLILGNNIKSIDSNAISYCNKLTTIVMPGSIETLPSTCIACCDLLKTIVIEDGVQTIQDYAIGGFPNIKSIVIPNSVTYIGKNTFGHYYDDATQSWKVIKDFTIYGYLGSAAETYANENGITFVAIDGVQQFFTYKIEDNAAVIISYIGTDATVNIPDVIDGYPVKRLDVRAFKDNTTITSVTFGDEMTIVNNYAFINCPNLQSVTFGSGLQRINYGAFLNCTSLTQVNLCDGIARIGSYAFKGCSSLESIIIPASVTNISTNSFVDCAANFTIYGYADSYAETFATDNNINFIQI